jgi:ankyrin repeat protein
MARLETEVPQCGPAAMTLARLAAIAVVALLIGGAVTACSRQPANTGGRDAGPHQATRNDDSTLVTNLRQWEARVQAKERQRPITAEPLGVKGGPPAAETTNTSQALLEAAQLGDAKLVKSLLARGADHKTLNEALLVAARSEPLTEGINGGEAKDAGLPYAETARLLLEKGASVEARDEGGGTALIAAAGHGEADVVRLLLDKGADIEAKDNEGITALIAAACDCPIIDMPDTDDSVRLLLENGANIEAKDKRGYTALMAAAAWGRASILQILLDKGIQIEARDNHGNTALLIASSGGAYPKADAVQLLLARGADIEARNNDGDTALVLAASTRGYEDIKIVRTLLNRGADVRAKNKQGHAALDMAAEKGRSEIVSLLKAAMVKSR